MSDLYKQAGVDIDAGNEVVKRIKNSVASTIKKPSIGKSILVLSFSIIARFSADKAMALLYLPSSLLTKKGNY